MKIQSGLLYFLLYLVLLNTFVICLNTFHLESQLHLPQYNLTDSVINAKYSAIAFCSQQCIEKWNCASSSKLNFFDPLYIYDKRTMVAGYIGYRSDTKSIILSLRGSSNNPNWYQDFNFQMIPYQKCKDCYIHAGFYLDFKLISDRIYQHIDKLTAKYQVTQFMATGHSLGAALSIISALQVKLKYGSKYNVVVHNFGQPRVCDQNLSQFMKLKLDGIYRVVHSHDLVPHLPFEWLPYKHVSREIFFDEEMKSFKICNQSGQDPTCSNQYYPNYTMKDHDFYFIMIDDKSQC